MRRGFLMILLGLAVALASTRASADNVEVRFGGFFPQGGPGSQPSSCSDTSENPTRCNLFLDLSELFGATRKGWEGAYGGIEYNRRLNSALELGFHIDGYGRTRYTSYVDYVRDDNSEIEQELHLSVVPIGVTLRVFPLGSRRALSPYIAGGGDLVIWHYSEFGDFIDFSTENENWDVVTADRQVSGTTPGFHVAAGIRVPVSYDFSLTAEVRYLKAKPQEMERPFEVYEIDPSGASATVGLNLRF